MADKVRLLVYTVAIVSFILIIRSMLIRTPATQAYLAGDAIAFLAFSYAFYKTKDKFWLIMLASTVPMFISDLYFIPSFSFIIPKTAGAGVGMNMWAGLHRIVISVGCFLYFKKSALNYANLIMLFATILTNTAFSSFLLSRSAIGYIVAFLWQAITIYYLIYYGVSKKKFIFSLGAAIELIGLTIVVLYYLYVSHDIQPLTLSLTDKIFAFCRNLMAIGAI
ncbi:MAG: hypothetical protein V1818_04385 [Candidatus Aenigmatarchaeota archaeon]